MKRFNIDYDEEPQFCPECEGTNISGEAINAESNSRDMWCNDSECKFEWREIYQFVKWEPKWL